MGVIKQEYNGQGLPIYIEYPDGCWGKYEYDDKGNKIYFENSYGNKKIYF
jgi:hypothetical protein